jgi:hypothetical protein
LPANHCRTAKALNFSLKRAIFLPVTAVKI